MPVNRNGDISSWLCFEPLDLSPLDGYELGEYVGIYGICGSCKQIHFIHAPGLEGICCKCQWGWVESTAQVRKLREVVMEHKYSCPKKKTT